MAKSLIGLACYATVWLLWAVVLETRRWGMRRG